MSRSDSRVDHLGYVGAQTVCVLIALLATSGARSQQVSIPDTPAHLQDVTLPSTKPGELLGELLKLCEVPQLDQITQWLTVNSPEEVVARGVLGFVAHDLVEKCGFNGGLGAQKIMNSSASAISVVGTGRKTNIWYNLVLETTSDGKIAGMWSQPGKPEEDSLPKDLSNAAIESDLTHTLSQVSEAGLFSGLVVVARGRNQIVTVSAGYADRSRRSPITGRTQFTLGSMGKMFTATGIGQLVDAHKLSFDDPVGKFFPEYPNKTVRDKATVGMLLSHTAGLGDFLAKRTPEMMKDGVKRAAEFMPLYDNDEPKFEPGTSWAYSNAGLALAGAILEKVSGEDYPDYLRKHIFAPARMTDSDPNNVPYHAANLVIPYTHQTPQGPSQDWQEALADIGSPAGGAISTANDLVRFADALRSGKLVSKATFEEMTRSHSALPGGGHYGYAMEIEDVYGSTVVGHAGGFPGVSTRLYLFLDAPYTVVVLANEDPPAEAYAASKAVALIAEKTKAEHRALR
jgi:CubicO group peptidase (beta-lactamase class C family)